MAEARSPGVHSRSERANVSAAVLACVCVSKSRTLVLKQWSENLRGSAASMPRESRFTPARAYTGSGGDAGATDSASTDLVSLQNVPNLSFPNPSATLQSAVSALCVSALARERRGMIVEGMCVCGAGRRMAV